MYLSQHDFQNMKTYQTKAEFWAVDVSGGKKKIKLSQQSTLLKASFHSLITPKLSRTGVKHCVTEQASKMGKSEMNWLSRVFIYTNKRAEHNLVASGIFHRH